MNYLYSAIDTYCCYIVDWQIACRENAELAHNVIEQICEKHDIANDTLVFHSDRSAAMKSEDEILSILSKTAPKPLNSLSQEDALRVLKMPGLLSV